MKSRTLTLKRESLRQLSDGELDGIVGGTESFSCLDYISCYPWDCVDDRIPTFQDRCIEA